MMASPFTQQIANQANQAGPDGAFIASPFTPDNMSGYQPIGQRSGNARAWNASGSHVKRLSMGAFNGNEIPLA